MIKIIGLDLDGTLLTNGKKVTELNRKALEEAAGSGVTIVPVTGRPLSGIPREITDYPFVRYAITSNGAVTTDLVTGAAIRSRCMSGETAEKVLRAAEGGKRIREYFTEGFGFHDMDTRELLRRRFDGTPVLSYLRQSRKLVDNLYKALRAQSGGIENLSVMCASREERDLVLLRIQKIDGIRIILPWATDIEITSVDADKGSALLDLAAQLGASRDEVMAAGDSDNDLSLMKAAGLSVAMGNATPEIMKAADFVTGDNEHDGVAEAIRRFVL